MRKFLVVTLTGAVAFVLLTIALVWAFSDNTNLTFVVRLNEIRPNKPLHLEQTGVYIVRRGDRVAAVDERLVVKDEQMGVSLFEGEVVYCVSSGLFEGDSKFDWRGRYYGGRAPHGLTTYPVEIRNGLVYVDFANPREGLPRSSPATEPFGPFCAPT